jgi:hypothetical protein
MTALAVTGVVAYKHIDSLAIETPRPINRSAQAIGPDWF